MVSDKCWFHNVFPFYLVYRFGLLASSAAAHTAGR
jgi:hypothetical protein